MLSTAEGFEPARAEPNGFQVHLLDQRDTLSARAAKFHTDTYRARITSYQIDEFFAVARGCLV